jgi:hypothetical protein
MHSVCDRPVLALQVGVEFAHHGHECRVQRRNHLVLLAVRGGTALPRSRPKNNHLLVGARKCMVVGASN